MACKCIKKLMVMMMDLLILILLQVQANELAHISFHPSSPPVMHPYFSELDNVQTNDICPTSFCPSPLPIMYPRSSELDEVKRTLHTCLAEEYKACEEYYLESPEKHYQFDNLSIVSVKLGERAKENLACATLLVCAFCKRDCKRLRDRRKLVECLLECYRKNY